IGFVEGWSVGDAVYFTFVTGLTIGYGDIVPRQALGRVLAIGIGVSGLFLTGLIAGIAVYAMRTAQRSPIATPADVSSSRSCRPAHTALDANYTPEARPAIRHRSFAPLDFWRWSQTARRKRGIIPHCMNDPQPEGHMASHIGRRKFLAASKTEGFKPIKFAIVFRVPA